MDGTVWGGEALAIDFSREAPLSCGWRQKSEGESELSLDP